MTPSNLGDATREAAELRLLHTVAQTLNESRDLHEAVSTVLRIVVEQTTLMRATITLLDPETHEIFIEEAFGLSTSEQERGRYQLGEGVTGQVVESGLPMVVERVSEHEAFLNRTGARRKLRRGDFSFVCVPLTIGREAIGAMSADRHHNEDVDLTDDVRLLQILGALVSQGVSLRRRAATEARRQLEENSRLKRSLGTRYRPDNIIGRSKPMRAVYDLIGQVAATTTSVLILGESGTGKELIANAIHFASDRAERPIIRVNCGALPEGVVESELFGHERGAFTGATAQRKGRFELADGGTIFLDEVGELTAGSQVKLLRVLQEREFERVGGTRTVPIDVRVIAATSRDLEELIDRGEFRLDLYYRLNVFPIRVPPLRERRGDAIVLADHFVARYNKAHLKNVRRIATSALDMLGAYHWPGNVRELENVIERAVLLSTDDVVHGHHLPPSLQTAEASGTDFEGTLQNKLDNLERTLILDALKSTRGNMTRAGALLGVTERIMGLRVRKHGIEPRRFKGR